MVVDGVASVRNSNEAQYSIVYVHRGIWLDGSAHYEYLLALKLIGDLYFAFLLETWLNDGYNRATTAVSRFYRIGTRVYCR